jgi:alanine racemase
VPFRHCANSAATILFPDTHFNFVRAGVALYGLWPSKDVRQEAEKGREVMNGLKMASHVPGATPKLVLNWKTRVVQIKTVSRGSFIGYGCSYRAESDVTIAILPVGYYDGFDRKLSGCGEVLVYGRRAKVCGRVCMNMIMVDVTDIPKVRVEDVVTLIGRDGSEVVTADEMAERVGTIHYEVVTRIREGIVRIEV